MLLSKIEYYADFVIYALLIALLALLAASSGAWSARIAWASMFAAGLCAWTLIEYLLHRFVLHGLPPFAELHARHHLAPRALVGTPTWLTLLIFGLSVFVPVWCTLSFNLASGLLSGVMMGFLGYGIVHHVLHHRRPRWLAARLRSLSRRHQQHHYATRPGNYGVSIALWDHLFRTALPRR